MNEEVYKIDDDIFVPRSILDDRYETTRLDEDGKEPDQDNVENENMYNEDEDPREEGEFEDFSRREFSDLIRKPMKGSLIAKILNVLSKRNNANEKQVKMMIERVVYDELLPFLLGTEYSGLIYIIVRLVAPHSIAVRVCQEFENELRTTADEYRFLTNWTKIEINKRGDLQKIVKQIAIMHPAIMKVARDAISKIKVE